MIAWRQTASAQARPSGSLDKNKGERKAHADARLAATLGPPALEASDRRPPYGFKHYPFDFLSMLDLATANCCLIARQHAKKRPADCNTRPRQHHNSCRRDCLSARRTAGEDDGASRYISSFIYGAWTTTPFCHYYYAAAAAIQWWAALGGSCCSPICVHSGQNTILLYMPLRLLLRFSYMPLRLLLLPPLGSSTKWS